MFQPAGLDSGTRPYSPLWERINPRLILWAIAMVAAGTIPSRATSAGNTHQSDWREFNRLVAHAQTIAMVAHPEAGLQEAQRAVAIAEQHNRDAGSHQALATALWLEAEALTRTNRITQAQATIATALRLTSRDGKLTKLDGDVALTQGRIAESSGDFAKALRSYQRAHAIFAQLGIPRSQSLALLGLGDVYEKARDFDREIRYYREAGQTYSGDPAIALAAANNLGFAYEQMGRYREAIPRLEQALTIAISLASPMLEAEILNNLATSYARTGKLAEAERAAGRALQLAGNSGENMEARFSWGARAEIEFRRGNTSSAAADLTQAFRGLNLKTTTPNFRDLHRVAYAVFRANGDLMIALDHLEAFKRLDDEGRALAASTNLVLLGAQFDFARQDLEIAHLRSAELERDIKLRKSQAEVQAIVFASTVLAGILLLGWIAWRHALLGRHRNAIAHKNAELLETLAERDLEIERRTAVESQLRLAMQAAQQASRAKSHFLANMSHELRTPLNAVIGFSELLVDGRTTPEKSQDYAQNIAEGGRHLLAVLNNVLDMARIESGKMALEEQPVHLGNVVEDALTALGGRDAHADKNIRSSGDHSVIVRGDEGRLRQALVNIISNAVKFTGAGASIEIRVERTEDGVDVVIQDDGEGIPAEKLPIVIEPFGQAENTYARTHGGVGLGLPIAKSLIELHGGRFTIRSECGRGTAVRIHLPSERVVDEGAPSVQTRKAVPVA